jgi:hypothetical protein
VTFTDIVIRLSDETLEEIDEAIENHPALTDRQEFLEQSVDWALSSLKQEAERHSDDQ